MDERRRADRDSTEVVERRRADRDSTEDAGISSFVELADGTVLEGVAKDFSETGAKISGPTDGLSTGDEVSVVLVILGDQKVRYDCQVKHVGRAGDFYGLEFKSPPQHIVEEEPKVKRCPYCKRRYTAEWKFCGSCGSELLRI